MPPKITLAMTEEMMEGLEEERKARRIATIPEIVRIILSEYFKAKAWAEVPAPVERGGRLRVPEDSRQESDRRSGQ